MHDWSVHFQSGKNLMISLLNCSMIRWDCETRAHLPYSSSKSLFLWIWIIIDNHIPHWQCSFKPRISSDLPGFHFMSPKVPLPCPLPWGVLKSLAQGLSAEDTLRRLPRQLLMLYAPWPLEMRWGGSTSRCVMCWEAKGKLNVASTLFYGGVGFWYVMYIKITKKSICIYHMQSIYFLFSFCIVCQAFRLLGMTIWHHWAPLGPPWASVCLMSMPTWSMPGQGSSKSTLQWGEGGWRVAGWMDMFQGYVLASLIALPQILWISWRLLANVGCYHILFLDCFVIHIRKVTKMPLKFPNSRPAAIWGSWWLGTGWGSIWSISLGAQPPCWTSWMCSQARGFGPARPYCRTGGIVSHVSSDMKIPHVSPISEFHIFYFFGGGHFDRWFMVILWSLQWIQQPRTWNLPDSLLLQMWFGVPA